ncbi:phage Gp19/Gp15/Gp42 family protein [Anaerofustis stercorihominis]|uniref:Phage protein Gp19/Gp15/Gp42 n=1 Tax=Anaerofustis stercorihominis TaxID=214853 RepID=A0A3E3DUL9_9FIRM|nr:phage Gp19/Gp15/Gp42 family protein [Anaerofustis stercorihominis]RGD72913.1 hypothetical protein DW687_11765 [Anaerofustis stercorihominis]
MNNFATIADITLLFRNLEDNEIKKAEALLTVVSNSLRYEADKRNKDLDLMIKEKPILAEVAKSVTVDIVARNIMTSTDTEPMTQYSESAGGYSVSGTFLNPGGGLFIKKSELARLGLKQQRLGVIELYGNNKRY